MIKVYSCTKSMSRFSSASKAEGKPSGSGQQLGLSPKKNFQLPQRSNHLTCPRNKDWMVSMFSSLSHKKRQTKRVRPQAGAQVLLGPWPWHGTDRGTSGSPQPFACRLSSQVRQEDWNECSRRKDYEGTTRAGDGNTSSLVWLQYLYITPCINNKQPGTCSFLYMGDQTIHQTRPRHRSRTVRSGLPTDRRVKVGVFTYVSCFLVGNPLTNGFFSYFPSSNGSKKGCPPILIQFFFF